MGTAGACLLIGAPAADAAPILPADFEQVDVAAFGPSAGTITDAAWTPDGRLLATDKDGLLWVQTSSGPRLVLDISDHVNTYRDRGLNGMAVDKDFATNHWVYLLYVYEHAPGDPQGRKVSRLTRITLNNDNTVVDPPGAEGPETTILGKSPSIPCPQSSNTDDCIPADYTWHTIGTVRSDPVDGTLWVGTGDATYSYVVDQQTFGTQDENSYRGKILHVDRNGNGVAGHPFCPADSDLTHACTKVYAKGFRNPFRFYLRPGKGPVAGDVGQDDREEIDLVKPGGNYGWPCYEGSIPSATYDNTPECQALYTKVGTAQAASPPAWEYAHAGEGASVLGGPAYAGSGYPSSYAGDIFVADYALGWVKRLDLNAAGDAVTGVSDFATYDPGTSPTFVDVIERPGSRNIAFVDIGWGNDPWVGGFVREFRYSPANRAPVAQATGTPLSGAAPLAVSFNAGASTDPDGDTLTYAWNFGDGQTGAGAAPAHTYSQPGTYTATVTVSDGKGGSATANVGPITPGNTAPTPTISAPADRATFRYGSAVSLSGSASDAQDGAIPSGSLHWQVRQQHNNHKHDFQALTGSTASFNPGNDHDADSYFEITLIATDSKGLTGTKTIRIDPETISLTLASVPSGAPLGYGTETVTAPQTRRSAIGFFTQLSAATSFVKNGVTYTFDRWSDGGIAQHNITIPATDRTLTATYNGRPTASGTATPAGTDAPAAVAFDGRASSDPEGSALTYDWDFGDGSAHGSGAQPSHTYAARGTYTPKLTVNDGGPGGSHTATLAAITITDSAPTASVNAPTLYRAGEKIAATGSATDRKDGTIPASSLSWKVFRNSSGGRTQVATGAGATMEYTPPNTNEVSWTYDFELTATDSAGNRTTESKRVSPRVTDVRVVSSPTGAATSWAGTSNFPKASIAGFVADATAPAAFVKNGDTYEFERWSDGNTALTRPYKVPDTGATLTAEYVFAPGESPPTATIDSPADRSLFDAGGRIDLRGSGSDAQSTPTLKWAVELHGGGTVTPVTVAGAAFTVPPDAAVDDWYRVVLTATDSAGLTATDEARLDPHTSTVRLDSEPAGAALSWNGAALTAPANALAVVGNQGIVGAPESFGRDGRRWVFGSWSDGGAREHAVSVFAGDPRLVAGFGLEPLPDPVVPSQPGRAPEPHPDPEPRRTLRVALPSGGLRLSGTGLVSFRVENPEASVWRGEIALASSGKLRVARKRSRRVTFARGSMVFASSSKRVVRLQLSSAGRKLVARLRRVRVTVAVTPSGDKPQQAAVSVLLPPRRSR